VGGVGGVGVVRSPALRPLSNGEDSSQVDALPTDLLKAKAASADTYVAVEEYDAVLSELEETRSLLSQYERTYGYGLVVRDSGLALGTSGVGDDIDESVHDESDRRRLGSTTYTSTFESDFDSWTTSTFLRLSGGTPSGSTGPSSAYDGSYYVYAETSIPNSPGVEFSMYRDFGDDVASVSFQYHMYGGTMGAVLLQGSDDGGSTYTTLWSKSGNQGNAWYGADVSIGSGYPQWLQFVYTSGSSYTGDFALDEVEVVAVAGSVPSPQPTASPVPTLSPVPSPVPSSAPSPVPTAAYCEAEGGSGTVCEVSTFLELSSSIQSNADINVVGNITFTGVITISGKTNVKISSSTGAVLTSDRTISNGYGGMFNVASGSDVTFTGLGFANGSATRGGCLYATGSTIEMDDVDFTSCYTHVRHANKPHQTKPHIHHRHHPITY
jgi:hypothetical protein